VHRIPIRDRWFRYFIGTIAVLSGLIGVGGLYFVDLPSSNERPLLLALGIVLEWGGSVIKAEFGASNVGRKLAERAAAKALK